MLLLNQYSSTSKKWVVTHHLRNAGLSKGSQVFGVGNESRLQKWNWLLVFLIQGKSAEVSSVHPSIVASCCWSPGRKVHQSPRYCCVCLSALAPRRNECEKCASRGQPLFGNCCILPFFSPPRERWRLRRPPAHRKGCAFVSCQWKRLPALPAWLTPHRLNTQSQPKQALTLCEQTSVCEVP